MSRLAAIVGPARSGTTWAGTLLDSSPDVIYRFEPFHRLAPVDTRVRAWMKMLKDGKVSDEDIPRIYELIRIAHPLTNKAPFFDDKVYPLRTAGRDVIWPLARLLPPARWLYGAAYSPASGPILVFKEVTFVRQLRNLIERTRIPVIYLVRHPCATVISGMATPKKGAIASRQHQLAHILRDNAPHLLELFPDVIDDTDPVRRNALLWRYEVEACVTLIGRSRRGLVMTYEQLASDAYVHGNTMFEHLGIPFSEQTRSYLDMLYDEGAGRRSDTKRTGWGHRYFSVYRNPRKQRDAWMQWVSAADRRKVEMIVRDSEVFQRCAAVGGWA